METDMSGKVRLDGTAIRRIREEQKLTQLYVAKVVGVTTDTVSRWENNRYPSVRQENAQLLAEALEVPVEQILLADEDGVIPALPARRKGMVLLLGFVVLLTGMLAYLLLTRSAPPSYQLSVERLLPPQASAATRLPVRVRIDVSGPIDGMVLRETIPTGFELVEASPTPSSLDNINGSVRWILPPAQGDRLVSYLLQAKEPLKVGTLLHFQGELVVNARRENSRMPVAGKQELPVENFHWADANRDLVIDDGEALDASVTSIEMEGVHVDWDLVEKIWDAGGYRYDADKQVFVAVRPGPGKKQATD